MCEEARQASKSGLKSAVPSSSQLTHSLAWVHIHHLVQQVGLPSSADTHISISITIIIAHNHTCDSLSRIIVVVIVIDIDILMRIQSNSGKFVPCYPPAIKVSADDFALLAEIRGAGAAAVDILALDTLKKYSSHHRS